MKLMRLSERLGYRGKSSSEKGSMISIGESYAVWTALVWRYDAIADTMILLTFAKDEDLKIIIKDGLGVLEAHKEQLEKLTKEFGIPMPGRPPDEANVAIDINVVTDQFIFRQIYIGIADSLFKHLSYYQRSHGSYLREYFRKAFQEELQLYDEFYEYGKQKSYLHEPPSFRR